GPPRETPAPPPAPRPPAPHIPPPAVTHRPLLQPHTQATLEHLRRPPATVLIVHDIVELDYSNQATLDAMGQIGNGGGRGYECHNALAVDPKSGELIGLACQQLHNRARKPDGEGVAAGREGASCGSLVGAEAARRTGPAPAGCHWVDGCDRGADTFEFLEHELRQGRHFVIRSTHSRALEVESEGRPHRLHDLLRSLPPRLGW